MGKQSDWDKAAVKAKVQEYLARHAGDSVTAGEVGAFCERETGLRFGLTTVGKYISGFGWQRAPRPKPHGGVCHLRPRP